MYATAAVAEQNSLSCTVPYSLYAATMKDPVALNCLNQKPVMMSGQQQPFSSVASTTLPSKHQTFISTNYNTMIPPHSKFGHVHKVSDFLLLILLCLVITIFLPQMSPIVKCTTEINPISPWSDS